MSTRAWIAALLALPLGAVLCGIGTVTVLCLGNLENEAMSLLPFVACTALVLAPAITWHMAPLLRVRVQRSRSTKKRLMEKHGARTVSEDWEPSSVTRQQSRSPALGLRLARAARH